MQEGLSVGNHQLVAESQSGDEDKFCSAEIESEKCGRLRRKPLTVGGGRRKPKQTRTETKITWPWEGRGGDGPRLRVSSILSDVTRVHGEKGLHAHECTAVAKSLGT